MEEKFDQDLPKHMANLDIMEIDNEELKESSDTLSVFPARVLRKRKSVAIDSNKSTNRRVNMKPRKHLAECASAKQIEALYMNKTVKATSQSLETIYEEPDSGEESVAGLGGKKVKRLLKFEPGSHYTKEKIKKRRAKIKRLLGNKSFLNRKRIPMHVFMKTLESLSEDESMKDEEQIS